MIDRETAKTLTRKLSVLPRFPREPEALGQLVDAIASADDPAHAERVVTNFAQRGSTCPLPYDVRRMLHETKSSTQSNNCSACSGTGWVSEKRGGYECARECSCRSSRIN